MRDVRTKLSKEECALGMEQRSNDVATKDVRTKLRREECALDMERRYCPNYAEVKDAPAEPGQEVYALGTDQRRNDADLKDVRTNLSEEECAGGMEQTAYESFPCCEEPHVHATQYMMFS